MSAIDDWNYQLDRRRDEHRQALKILSRGVRARSASIVGARWFLLITRN